MRNSMLAALAFIMLSVMLAGCGDDASDGGITGNAVSSASAQERVIAIDKLEIYHFHATSQCYSCVTVGEYAEETLTTYFKEELESGIIVFDHIDGQHPENRDLVIKYGATGSSLWLGVYEGESFEAEENINVWYRLRSKQGFMEYLKGVIEQKLAGK